MNPKITIDKYAIRFENDKGGLNLFFKDLFMPFNKHHDWHMALMEAIQEAYEICIKENIEPPKEEDV